jgi:hypothetical protein
MTDYCLTSYDTPTFAPIFTASASFSTADVKNLNICLGVDFLDSQNGLNDWLIEINKPGICNTVFDKYINDPGSNTVRAYNAPNMLQLQKGFEYTFSHFYNKNSKFQIVDAHNTTKYTPFQENLFAFCAQDAPDIRGVCNLAQNYMCSGCKREDLQGEAQNLFCGCYVPMDELALKNGVSPECDPICSMAKVFKKRDEKGLPQECNDSVCVINNISIVAAKSVLENISFNQICPACASAGDGTSNTQNKYVPNPFSGSIIGTTTSSGTGSFTPVESGCECIIDASIPGIGQKIGVDNPETFGQYCGSKSVCLTVDDKTGEQISVECKSALSDIKPNVYTKPVPITAWIIAGLIVLIGALFILSSRIESRSKR